MAKTIDCSRVFISLVLIISANSAVNAGDKSNFRGRMQISNAYTGITNRNITGFPAGYNNAIDIYGTGRFNDIDVSGRLSVIYNSWDELDIFDGYLKVKKNKTDVQLGNVRANFSEYSVLNKNFLGAMLHYEISKDYNKPDDRVMDNLRLQLLKIPQAASINIEEVYTSSVENQPKFRKSDIYIIYGQTEKSIEINEKVDFQSGRRSTFPQFQQFMTAGRFQTEPITAMRAGLGLYHFKDKPSSVLKGGVGTTSAILPQENLVLNVDGALFLFSDRLLTEGEFAYSKLDENLFSEADTFINDNAYRFRAVFHQDNIDADVSYRRLGGDFLTIGNELTRTINNREGIYSIFRYRFPYNIQAELKVDRYKDNLNNRNLFTHTRTIMDGTLDFNLPVPTTPRILINFRQSNDKTPRIATGLILTEGNITRSGNILVQSRIGKTFISSSYSEIRFDDRYEYSLAVRKNDFKNTSWVVNVLDRTIPRTEVRLNLQRSHHRFIFADQDIDRRRGEVDLTINLIPNRLNINATYILAKNVDASFTLKEDRKYAGIKLRIKHGSWIGFSLENERMHYTPDDPVREFNARKIKMTYEMFF